MNKAMMQEKELKKTIKSIMEDIIAGSENEMEDNPKGSKEYEDAKAFLEKGHEELVSIITANVMSDITGAKKEMKFMGTEKIKWFVSQKLQEWGY